MKVNKIIQICKKAGKLTIYEQWDGIQWLSDGSAAYPLFNLPKFDESSLCATYDIDEKQLSKITFQNHLITEETATNFSDTDENEILCTKEKMCLSYNGNRLIPIKTQTGIVFIDEKYFTPIFDVINEIELYQRMTVDGTPYFAVKVGLIVYAIILPINVIDNEFVEQLGTLYDFCKIALDNQTIGLHHE